MPSSRLSVHTLVKTIFVICIGWYLFHGLLSSEWIFAHPDTRDLYFYFKKYSIDSIWSGSFPLWNHNLGIGTPNIVWGHFPFDSFTLLEILFGFDETIYTIETLCKWSVIFFALFLILRHFKVASGTSIFLAAMYLLTPLTSHYIIQGYVSLGIGLALLSTWAVLKFVRSGRKRWLLSSAIFLSASFPGYKVEFWPFSLWLVAFFPFLEFIQREKPSHSKLNIKGKILGFMFPVVFALVTNFALIWIYGSYFGNSERMPLDGSISSFFNLSIHIDFFKSLLSSPVSAPLSALILSSLLKNKGYSKNWSAFFSGIIFIFVISVSIVTNPDSYLFSNQWWHTLLAVIAVSLAFISIQKKRGKPKLETLAHLTNGLVRFWVFFYIFNSLTIPTEQLEYQLFSKALALPLLGVIFAGLLWFPARKSLRLAVIGGIAFVLTREVLQTYFIQMLGFIWHPKRDEFIFQFFFILATGVSIQYFTTVLRRARSQGLEKVRLAIRFLPIFFSLALVLQAKQYLTRFDTVIWNTPSDFDTKQHIADDISSAVFGKENDWPAGETPGIFAIPPKEWRDEDPWTSDFPLNPGVFLLGGLRDLRQYNSITPVYYSGLMGFVSYGKFDVFKHPVINHTFPKYITDQIHKSTENSSGQALQVGETQKLGGYQSLRSELLTLNSNILRALGANAVVTLEPITKDFAKDSLYFTQPSDLENLEAIGSRKYPNSPYEYFLYRIIDREPFIRPISKLICINDGYASEISEMISFVKKLPNQVIVNCEQLPKNWAGSQWPDAKINISSIKRGYDGINLEIHSDEDTLVAVRNQFTPDMFNTLDETPIDGYRADLIQTLYFIPKGTHTLKTSFFNPMVVKKILLASGLLLIILILALILTGKNLILSETKKSIN